MQKMEEFYIMLKQVKKLLPIQLNFRILSIVLSSLTYSLRRSDVFSDIGNIAREGNITFTTRFKDEAGMGVEG
jgi:hypothetical protein